MTHEMTSDVFQQMWNGIEMFTTSASAAVVTQMTESSSDVNGTGCPLKLAHTVNEIIAHHRGVVVSPATKMFRRCVASLL